MINSKTGLHQDWFVRDHLCHGGILESIGAVIGSLGATGAAAGGAAAAGTAADIAAVTLPEVAVTAAAPAALGLGDIAATAGTLGAAGLGAAGAAGALGGSAAASGLPASLTGAPPALTGSATNVGAQVPGGGAATGTGAAAAPSGAVSGPALGAAPAPTPVAATGTAPLGSDTTLSNILAGSPQTTQLAGAGGSDASFLTPTEQAAGVTSTGQLLPGAEGAVPGVTAPASTGGGSFLSNIGSDISGAGKAATSFLQNNGTLLGLGGLGAALLMENQQLPGQGQVSSIAGQELAQGQQLENYLQTGTLPPGVQGGIDQATQSAIASIKSQQAALGGYTSSEAQDINAANNLAAAQGANIAMQLYNTGVSQEGQAAQLYQYIMQNALQQDTALGNAIAGFAGSLVPKNITVNQTAAS